MKKSVYIIYLLVFVFVFTEIVLRFSGFKPGTFFNFQQFETVDSLFEYKNYTTDGFGIYKFSPSITDSIPKYFNKENFHQQSEVFNHIMYEPLKESIDWGTDHIGEIITDFTKLNLNLLSSNDTETSEFARYIQAIFKKKDINQGDQAVLDYLSYPFNKEGFRSIDFHTQDSNKIKVLLIGDSFTYGQSARPMYNSFADILLARDYLVYNTGISGTDPAQYFAIAKKYIPMLQPDIVIVNYCINNDLMSFYRAPAPDKPHEYLTNAGFFESYISGEFYDVEDAYEFYEDICTIPQTNTFNKIASKSAFLSKIWGVLYRFNLVKHPTYKAYSNGINIAEVEAVEITASYLKKIKTLATKHNTPILVSFIPDISRYSKNFNEFVFIEDEATKKLAQQMLPHYPTNFLPEDFASGGDFHFNNKGATKYADFLEKLINETLFNE